MIGVNVKPTLMRSAGSQWCPAPGFPDTSKASEPVETVLVVDDDPILRDLESRVLRLGGYTVLEASGAAEALRVADKAVAIHLLITDFMMPDVDGLELTRRFRADHPQTPVLMVSGSFPLVRDRIEGLDRFEFLEKPFGIAELFQKVRSLLDLVVPRPMPKSPCSN